MTSLEESVANIFDAESAARLLAHVPSPAMVRAVVQRAEEMRFNEPNLAFDIALAAVTSLGRLPREVQRPRLVAITWAVFGSACRALARFDEAEIALSVAGHALAKSNARGRADVARRLAVLRADQRREGEARQLMASVLEHSRQLGARQHGEELIAAASILIQFNDFRTAARQLELALVLLPHNGDRFHLAAIYNLARCRLELSSTDSELYQAAALVRQASAHAESSSFFELRLIWMSGNLLRRLGRYQEAESALLRARAGIDSRGDGFDRALLFLDLAELHLEQGSLESARHLAMSSFGVLQALHNQPDAFRAIQLIHRAATDLSLDEATVRTVRGRLLASRS